jgi:hypothetical protein
MPYSLLDMQVATYIFKYCEATFCNTTRFTLFLEDPCYASTIVTT